MTPEEYKKIAENQLEIIKQAKLTMFNALNMADKCSLPKNIRRAKPYDIQKGNIIWHTNGDDGYFWQIISEVLNPNDKFKAYLAEDGCRYGLDDAYIEKKDLKNV